MKNVNWTEVASIAACFSAFFSLIGIGVNAYYSRKAYRANLEIKNKLDVVNSIKELVPKYIAETNYALYLHSKAWANVNDINNGIDKLAHPKVVIGRTELADYDDQLTKAKKAYFELKANLDIYDAKDLLADVVALWNVLSHENLNKISSTATNIEVSESEQKVFNEFETKKNKLTNDLIKWYKQEFRELAK